jgi:uncharacterized protein (TIGR02266 family)
VLLRVESQPDYIGRFESGVKWNVCILIVMSAKTILIAHRDGAVRDRFAAALADARHDYITADSAAAAEKAVADGSRPVNLVLVDLGLAEDGVALVRALRRRRGQPLPVVVFSGSVMQAGQVPPLSAMNVGYVNEHATTPQILPALAPHLFPDNFNRRASARIALGVPVTYQAGQTIAGAVTLDVGRGGLAIRTMSPLPKGTAVQIRFRLPGGSGDIDVAARVAWSNRKTGMGVQFEQVSANDQRIIDTFIESGVRS